MTGPTPDGVTVTVTLDMAVALVLDSVLARLYDPGATTALTIDDGAEWHALADIHAALEGVLLSHYSQDEYAGQLATARRRVLDWWGEPGGGVPMRAWRATTQERREAEMVDSARYYDEHAEEFYAASVGADMTALHDAFLAHIPADGHILDAGCGSGRDSRAFLDRGYRVTALDASAAMVARASALLGQPVLHRRFEELDFDGEFDGIWACASLLHVPRGAMPGTFDRLALALLPGGVLFASFKWGEGEVVRDGRLFTSYTPGSFIHLLAALSVPLAIVNVWQTEDVRPGRAGEYWLDALLRKG